jgi:O-antigen ligase
MNAEPKQTSIFRKSDFSTVPIPVLVSLLFYISTLAATQTVYGYPFMELRWIGLGTFTLVSFIYWLLGRIPRQGLGHPWGDPIIVFIYLGATLLSITTAENYKFSGLRWATQGMLILSCMVFLRGTFNTERIKDLTLPLKVISLALLSISFLFPAPMPAYESPYFQGAMGDSNSLGHVSAICTLVFLYGAITARKKGWRVLQVAVTIFSFFILVRSGARSSMVAFIVGFILVNFYFGVMRSLLAKAVVFLLVALIFGSPMLQSKAVGFLIKEERKNEHLPFMLVSKGYGKMGILPESVFGTRERLWSESWEGFLQRPFWGWGFGANANTPKEWSISPTGTTVSRDITNDPLFILEGCGVIGFLGYLLLVISILKQSPTLQELSCMWNRFRRRERPVSMRLTSNNSRRINQPSSPPQYGGKENDEDLRAMNELKLSRAYSHSQMYILSVSLFVLFFFDGSAFSAGSFISSIFWISAGMANLTKKEAIASERMKDRISGRGFKGFNFQGSK